MKSVFEWSTEQLKYGVVRHRCTFLGMRVGRIFHAERETAFRAESFVEFAAISEYRDLGEAKSRIEAEAVRWFEAAATACGETPYRAEDHPDLFAPGADKGSTDPSTD